MLKGLNENLPTSVCVCVCVCDNKQIITSCLYLTHSPEGHIEIHIARGNNKNTTVEWQLVCNVTNGANIAYNKEEIFFLEN